MSKREKEVRQEIAVLKKELSTLRGVERYPLIQQIEILKFLL